MRSSGILLPISSLPGKYGIGTFGIEAYNFIDFLKKANQHYWQILPLGPTTFGDSPYQTYSTFAGSEVYIDLDDLYQDKLITKKELNSQLVPFGNVDYDELKLQRMNIYLSASKKFFKKLPDDYQLFVEKHQSWLLPYAQFRALKKHYNETSFNMWPEEVIKGDISSELLTAIQDDVNLHIFIQYYFYKGWNKLKQYANINGVKFIGDLPIYVSYDSSDVWQNPSMFQLDENLQPTAVAGCPPDAFSEDGQLWGNPLYNYDVMKEDNYKWWMDRIVHNLDIYDVLRIDHFRGFEAYFSIPSTDTTAKNGHWEIGPGYDIFEALFKIKPTADMIMEDLGYLTPSVYQLLKRTGFPGMRVLEFAFDGRNDNAYLPHNYIENTIVYPGTHDNVPLYGWIKTLSDSQINQIFSYYNIENILDIPQEIIKSALSSIAKLAIIPLQDYLKLDEDSRINTPSTVGCNWKWRVDEQYINDDNAEMINKLTKKYFR